MAAVDSGGGRRAQVVNQVWAGLTLVWGLEHVTGVGTILELAVEMQFGHLRYPPGGHRAHCAVHVVRRGGIACVSNITSIYLKPSCRPIAGTWKDSSVGVRCPTGACSTWPNARSDSNERKAL